MKQAKIIAIVFGVITEVLLCAMCSIVSYSYRNLICAMEHVGGSAPPSVAFLLAIPFGIGIAVSAVLCWIFYRKAK